MNQNKATLSSIWNAHRAQRTRRVTALAAQRRLLSRK